MPNFVNTTSFDAAAARKQTQFAQSIDGRYLRKETDEVIAAIKTASATGKSTICTRHTDQVIRQRLITLGFKVVHVPGDQRDPQYLDVSW
jgi:hypothetical protein